MRACKFSAYEEDNFVTCGKDSIRMYRLKGGRVHGMSVGLANGNDKVREVCNMPVRDCGGFR